jgi:hypothetical protein
MQKDTINFSGTDEPHLKLNKLQKFVEFFSSLDCEITLELQNYYPPFKFALISNEELSQCIQFYKNPQLPVPSFLWQPFARVGSNEKLDKYFLTIFGPGFETVSASIVSDQTGAIYIHETFRGGSYETRFLANDIYTFINECSLSFKNLPTIKDVLNRNLKSNVWLDGNYTDAQAIFDVIISAIKEANSGINTSYEIKNSKDINGFKEYEIELNLNDIKLSMSYRTKEYIFQIIKDINNELLKYKYKYEFALLHENKWDSMHILGFITKEDYELLMKKNLIAIRYLK